MYLPDCNTIHQRLMRSLFPQPNPSFPASIPPLLLLPPPLHPTISFLREGGADCLERAVRASCHPRDQHVCETIICESKHHGRFWMLVKILQKTENNFLLFYCKWRVYRHDVSVKRNKHKRAVCTYIILKSAAYTNRNPRKQPLLHTLIPQRGLKDTALRN